MSFSQGLAKIKENDELRSKSTPIAMVAPELKQNPEDTEITKTCAVLGCEESKNLNSDSFFRFPEDLSLRQIWTDLTGRNNWTPTDYSYICVQHFSVDCFECDSNNIVVLNSKAVPSLKLPKHVLEVEYIDEETFDNEYEDDEDEDYEMENQMETDTEDEEQNDDHEKEVSIQRKDKKLLTNGTTVWTQTTEKSTSTDKITGKATEKPTSSNKKTEKTPYKSKDMENLELLKLFTEVQKMQKRASSLNTKLKSSMRIYKRQNKCLVRLKEMIEMKKNLLNQKRKKRSRILLSLQDKIKEDTNGLVLAMPTRHTDELKNFALSIYKYSPQAYIYIRNTLRTLLPSTDVLDTWVNAGYEPKNVLSNSNLVKVIAEMTDTELSCKVSLR